MMVLTISLSPAEPVYASINSWYGGKGDNVLNDGNVNGWKYSLSKKDYGSNIAGGQSYRFGPLINYYGTWGQLIYSGQQDLVAEDTVPTSGIRKNRRPCNPATDGGKWVQGHLVNGKTGGKGNLNHNLTPISNKINRWHTKYEGVWQRLVNRGISGTAINFNPHNIPDSRLIYRTHALRPRAGRKTPNGIAVSLGIVIRDKMITEAGLRDHFSKATGTDRWFSDLYYGNGALKKDREVIMSMVSGVEKSY